MKLACTGPLAMTDIEDNWEPSRISQDDDVLIEAAKRDPQAFAPLYERYRQGIFLYCYRRLGTPEAADDATSIVFVKAFAAIGRFRPSCSRDGSTFRSWLFSIAHNVVIDNWRRSRRHESLDASDDETFTGHLIDRGKSPEEVAIGAEEERSVVTLLSQLPDRHRAVVELRLAGLSSNEIAHALGLSASAAKSIQFRAYRALRDLVDANPDVFAREGNR